MLETFPAIRPFPAISPHCNNSGKSEMSEEWVYDLCSEDVTWILMAAFIIFTMQTGFGMLESGCVSIKNEANIMMKNFVDVVLGGMTYWTFGYSLSYGTGPGSNAFVGVGQYAVDSDHELMGPMLAAFLFHLSFATTATTIVSGTMAERCSFKAYCIFSLLNTIVYCIPARWVWAPAGFLNVMGAVDIAGSSGVHILGGASGFVGAWMLGPRQGRYDKGIEPRPLGSPMNSLVGLFVLWWGWLAFNSGSTYGVRDSKWKFAARAAVNTMLAAVGGGLAGTTYSFLKPAPKNGGKKIIEVIDVVNPILGGLVASTAGCALYHTPEAFVTGLIGGALVILTSSFADRMGVDDPVGTTAVHGFAGFWGMMAVGFFAEEDQGLGFTHGNAGIFRGGDTHLLQVQLFACLCIALWSGISTAILLWLINKVIPIRMGPEEEALGADFYQHRIRRNPETGQIITTPLRKTAKISGNLELAAVTSADSSGSAPAQGGPCRLINQLNRWRQIRMKALAASFFSIRLRKNRMSSSVASLESIGSGNVVGLDVSACSGGFGASACASDRRSFESDDNISDYFGGRESAIFTAENFYRKYYYMTEPRPAGAAARGGDQRDRDRDGNAMVPRYKAARLRHTKL